jgi:hypothetical protein
MEVLSLRTILSAEPSDIRMALSKDKLVASGDTQVTYSSVSDPQVALSEDLEVARFGEDQQVPFEGIDYFSC